MVNQQSLNELALFAGAGGGILGGHLLGWRTVCAVEWEPYPASVLVARQNDKILPPFPIWDDVQTFDGKPWRGIVDVVSGGFPCQDISAAGRGVGIDGERSGMWKEMARIIHEIRPKFAFVENSPMLTSRGLGVVLGDLASMGFDARWGVLGAVDVGANHKRDRIWIYAKRSGYVSHAQYDRIRWWEQQSKSYEETNGELANARCQLRSKGNTTELDTKTQIGTSSSIFNQSSGQGQANMANSSNKRLQGSERLRDNKEKDGRWIEGTYGSIAKHGSSYGKQADWWQSEPNVGRVAHGVAARVDRLKAIGNGQVPLCAATAWRILNEL